MARLSEAEKKRRREAARELAASTSAYQAAARPVVKKKPPPPPPKRSAKYDVPVPKTKIAEVKKATAEAKKERNKPKEEHGFFHDPFGPTIHMVKTGLSPGKTLGIVGKWFDEETPAPKMVGSNIKFLSEMGSGFLPAVKTVGKMGWRDAVELDRDIRRGDVDMPTRKDIEEYVKLLEYGWEEGDKKGKKRPTSESEIGGLIAQVLGQVGRTLEKATPDDPTSKEDWLKVKKAWSEDLIETLLDVYPVAAAATRPLSVAGITNKIAKANDISRAKAVRAAIKESYVPGSAARGKLVERDGEVVREGVLEGGIEPRVLRADVGGGEIQVGGRPWSRTPIARGLQRATDKGWEASPFARHRVGSAQRRLDAENLRRTRLDQTILEKPIADLLYGRISTLQGSFGLKKHMTAKERRAATGLAYTFQLPKGLSPDDALRAVQDDLSEVLQDGMMDVRGKSGTMVKAYLSHDQKQNLAIQIEDLDLVRQELKNGDITADEWDAGLEAMGDIADKTHELGIDILARRGNLGDDGIKNLEDMFGNRNSLLYRRLVEKGHLQQLDDATPYGYFPHRDIHAEAEASARGGVRPPAAGQTLGVPQMKGDAVQLGANELSLYQGGAMNPDPGSLVSVFLNRLRFQQTLDARNDIWEVGNDMSVPIPKKTRVVLVRNPEVPAERIAAEVQGAARGRQLERPVEGDLDESLRITPEEFRKEVIALSDERPAWTHDNENVRWVEEDYVKSRFGEVFASAPRGSLASAGELLTSAQRLTGIYGRPIAYIGGNVPFNVMALLSSMPLSTIRSIPRALGIRKNNPELWKRLASEPGETRATGGLPDRYTRAQGGLQQSAESVTQFQRGMAEWLSKVADDPFRVVALLNNAAKRGIKTDRQLMHMLDENGTDLADVRQMTREQMLDFDALNPSNRKFASQLAYLWPFIYASVKWPAMFAREYPARAALTANVIKNEDERVLPQEVTGLWKRFGIDLNTLNPTGPMGSVAEDLQKLVDDPGSMDLTVLKERLTPTLTALVEGMEGGQEDALINFIRGTVPGAAEYFSKDPQFRGAKVYKDRSRESYLGQRHVRYWPRGINKERLGEMISDALSDRVKGSTHEKAVDEDWKKLVKYANLAGTYTDEEEASLRTSFKAWWEYQEAVDQKKDSLGQRKLTARQQIEVLAPVIENHYPDIEVWDTSDMDDDYQKKYAKELDEYVTALKEHINAGRTMVFNDYSSYSRSLNKEDLGPAGRYGGEDSEGRYGGEGESRYG